MHRYRRIICRFGIHTEPRLIWPSELNSFPRRYAWGECKACGYRAPIIDGELKGPIVPFCVVMMSQSPCEADENSRCVMGVFGPFSRKEAQDYAKTIGKEWLPHLVPLELPESL